MMKGISQEKCLRLNMEHREDGHRIRNCPSLHNWWKDKKKTGQGRNKMLQAG